MGEARESPLTMICAINDAFANHPDENMQMRAMSADWTAAGQIIFQFLDVPREGAENIIRNFVHARNWGPGNDLNMITVERHIRTSQLCFRGVACIGDDNQPLDARQVAEAAFRNSPVWQEMLPLIRRVSFIPPQMGSSTTTLVVEIADTSTLARQRALVGTQATFPNATRTAQAMEDRKQVPQCTVCLRWGHVRRRCRSHIAYCERCGGPHDVRHHRALAMCCMGSTTPTCEHPPVCINCGQGHRATARECPYYIHRNDFAWHEAHPPAATRGRRATTSNNEVIVTHIGRGDARMPWHDQPTGSASNGSSQRGSGQRRNGKQKDTRGTQDSDRGEEN
ncbi:hypothetical protein C8Q73DRAFT_686108 [Cubamyces lactineus]|nr:hypothetical protein C8Q73DRAFT_686108 [Cubamyces lactineus]